jgi:hypothetical protein
MVTLAAFELTAIVLALAGIRLLRCAPSGHGNARSIAEAIATGMLAGLLVLVAGLVLSAAAASLAAPACANGAVAACPERAERADIAMVGGIALTMLVAPLAIGFVSWRRERALRHGLGAMLVIGASPWVILGGVALAVAGS